MNILNLVQPWHIQNSEYNQRHSQDPGLFRAPGIFQNQRHTQNLVKHLRWNALRNS